MYRHFLQLETNDKALRKEITFAIKNQFGVRVGLFTPDMAFEAIVKTQINKLLQPALKCVDLVSSELGEVIQKCGEGVSHIMYTHQDILCACWGGAVGGWSFNTNLIFFWDVQYKIL